MSQQILPPPAIEEAKARIQCPRCGARRADGRVMVLLRNPAPGIWVFLGKCFDCQLAPENGFWAAFRVDGDQATEQPVRERTGEDVPLPDAFKGIIQ